MSTSTNMMTQAQKAVAYVAQYGTPYCRGDKIPGRKAAVRKGWLTRCGWVPKQGNWQRVSRVGIYELTKLGRSLT